MLPSPGEGRRGLRRFTAHLYHGSRPAIKPNHPFPPRGSSAEGPTKPRPTKKGLQRDPEKERAPHSTPWLHQDAREASARPIRGRDSVKHHECNREPSRMISSTWRYVACFTLRSSGCVVPFALLNSVPLVCKGSEPRPQSACGCPVAFLADCSCRGWLNRSRHQSPLHSPAIARAVPRRISDSRKNARATSLYNGR